jgi:2-oxoglutarate dehydrogenase E2 component (dihydrolipoamide succinyltransferase)
MKSVGDEVAMDEVVAQIETDKVTVDVRAPSAGRVTDVRAKAGDTVTVGQTVMTVSPSAGKKVKEKREAKETKETKEASGPPTTVEVPSMGDSISEGAVAAVHVKPGQKVAMDEVIAQIETDKVTIDVRASTSGTVTEVLVAEGETVAVGRGVAVVTPGPGPEKRAPAGAAAPSAETTSKATTEAKKTPTPAEPAREAPSAGASASRARAETRVPMSRLRLRVAERLKSSQNTYAMLTTFNEIDMSNVMQMRTEYKDAFLERHGVKLGFMSTFVTAAAKALQEEPSVNAIIDGDEIVYRNYVDISVAVSAPKGLVVPVLRNCEKMSFADVEGSIAAFGKKARAGSLSIDEMAGGTFTISNGGVFGSLTGTPIINPPQSAILGMHSIVWRPVCVGPDHAIVARPMMNVALTYDHRLVDGREAVTFLKSIKESVEDPRRMMLSV